MGWSYEPEKLEGVKQSYENLTDFTTELMQAKDEMKDVATAANVERLKEVVNSGEQVFAAFAKMIKSIVGEDGDKASNGTLIGIYNSGKAMNESLNG